MTAAAFGPDFAAAAAAERERRAPDRAESPQAPSGQCETDAGPPGPQRGVQGQHGASSVQPEDPEIAWARDFVSAADQAHAVIEAHYGDCPDRDGNPLCSEIANAVTEVAW